MTTLIFVLIFLAIIAGVYIFIAFVTASVIAVSMYNVEMIAKLEKAKHEAQK